MNSISNARHDLIFHLEKAIENNEFEVFYQPIIHTISGSLCGFEALVRWHHPQYGFLNPGQFIEVLESTKQIYHLDIHLIELVCSRIAIERRACRPIVPVSVNLSRHDFESADMFKVICDIVKKYDIPRNMINIEVTESAFAEDENLMSKTINQFRKAGFQVWMDDFGSGYSSLNTLKDFDFDELKIDMRFLSDMTQKSKRIISSIISMAKNIGMVTLVEGVENEEQVRFLKSIGCDRLQGYYFSKPMPYDDLIRLLKEKQIPFETDDDRRYYHEVNRINLLSPSPFSVSGGYESHGGGIPLSILEFRGPNVNFIFQNEEFSDALSKIGAVNATDALQKLVHYGIVSDKEMRGFFAKAKSHGDNRIEFSVDGDMCSARAKLIAESETRHAYLISINNITRAMDINHEQMMDQKLRNIYSLYLRVSIIRPDKNEIITVFTQRSLDGIQSDVAHDLHELINSYSESDVSEEDRNVYISFLDPATLKQRVHDSERGFINTKIHTRDQNGEFSNKMYLAVAMGNDEILLLVRYANL